MGAVFTCTSEAVQEITVITKVPHLNFKEVTRVKSLCSLHAKRFRNKLNYQIKELDKTKTYIIKEI